MQTNRKLKSLNNKTGQKIITEINSMLSDHDRVKECYFWSNTGNASDRRRQEFDRTLSFNLNGSEYQIGQSLNISCKNFYYQLSVYVDGNKKDVRVLKKLTK